MNIQEQEDRDFTYATDTDWDRADALQRGEENPDLAWICTDRDVWHANPFYQGPAVPHPEMYDYSDDEALEESPELQDIEPADPACFDDDIPF